SSSAQKDNSENIFNKIGKIFDY
ncbi:hypothetical protein LCGC14_2371050, partial [marine sediment metagenome]